MESNPSATARWWVLPLLFASSVAFGAEGTGTADQYIKDRYEEVVEHLGCVDPDNKTTCAKNARQGELFDFQSIAEESLGNEWAARTGDEQVEFRDLLTRLVKQSYRKSLGKVLSYQVTIQDAKPTKCSTAGTQVKTLVVKTKGAPKGKPGGNTDKDSLVIVYELHQVSGCWRITDVVVDDVSMVDTYNNQFRRFIKKNGYAALISNMKARAAKGDQ